MMIVVLSAAAGILLASVRFPVFSLVPVVVSFAAGAAGTGIVAGTAPKTIALEVIGSIVAPQYAYLGVSLVAELICSSRWLLTFGQRSDIISALSVTSGRLDRREGAIDSAVAAGAFIWMRAAMAPPAIVERARVLTCPADQVPLPFAGRNAAP
jgi:hypothetical protein